MTKIVDENKQTIMSKNNTPVVCGWIIRYLGGKIDSLREDNATLQVTKYHQQGAIYFLNKMVATQQLINDDQRRIIGYQRLTLMLMMIAFLFLYFDLDVFILCFLII
jgi:hypothetical protein